jgi:hypothetical protein
MPAECSAGSDLAAGTQSGADLFQRWRTPMKDAFDQWWEWANKPFSEMATIPAEIHQPVMALPPEDRQDRAKVNEAVRRHQRDRRSALGPAKRSD